MTIERLKSGHVVFAEGAGGATAYRIVSGAVLLLKAVGGRQVEIGRVEAGAIIGEQAALAGDRHTETARTVGKTEVEPLSGEELRGRMAADPAFAEALIRQSARLRATAETGDLDGLARKLNRADGRVEDDIPRRGWGRRRRARAAMRDYRPEHQRIAEARAPAVVRLMMLVLLATLVGGIGYLSIATIDVTVTSAGRVVTTEPNIPVATLDGGIIREIRVQPGDRVGVGHVLAVLDGTVTEAGLEVLRRSLVAANAQIQRLIAERDGTSPEHFSADSEEDELQRNLFDSRQRQHQATLKTYDDDVRTLNARLSATRAEAEVVGRQVGVLRELVVMRENLYQREREAFQREGVHRVNLLEAQRLFLNTSREQVQLTTSLAGFQTQIDSRQSSRLVYLSDWYTKISENLISLVRERQRLIEELRKSERSNRLIELAAPRDAVVLQVASMSNGTIIRPAETVFELVPMDVPLVVDLDVPTRDIGRIRKGDVARVKLDTLNYVRHGTLRGTVQRISSDVFEKTLSGQPGPVYRVRLSIEGDDFVNLPRDFKVTPGTTITADIRVDERVLISYFLYPILATLESALREPF